jgi:glycosyltransferase involved in cell wall biosynthesis
MLKTPPSTDPRPACLVTGTVNDYRMKPYRLLAREENVEVLAFNDSGPAVKGLIVHQASQRMCARLAGSGRYRAVICGLVGRVALPGSYLAARRAGVPFVLWATIWAHPRTPTHALSFLPTLWLYKHADAIATYGPHVSRHVIRRRENAIGVFEAPQAVDAAHFGRPVTADERAAARERAGVSGDGFLVLFTGRLEREKGLHVLLDAWRRADLGVDARLALAGDGPLRSEIDSAGRRVRLLGRLNRAELPAMYAASDVLVLPSIRTATFKEPWGLVCNEAMHQGTPIVATDCVGAAAGGLVRDGRNSLIAPAGDAAALAACLQTLAANPELRARLGQAALEDVAPYTPAAWAEGMSRALAHVGASIKGEIHGRELDEDVTAWPAVR